MTTFIARRGPDRLNALPRAVERADLEIVPSRSAAQSRRKTSEPSGERIILAEQFAKRFDGFSIGSNDLTQLVLGIDRDSDRLRHLFDERDEAVTAAISELLLKARRAGAKTGICGQAPSDRPEFARFLVEHGIDSISVSPDSFLAVKRHVAEAERQRRS